AVTQAVSTPTTIEATIATADIWEETSSGRRLRGWVKISTKFGSVYSGGMIWGVQVPFAVKASGRIEATADTGIASSTADHTGAPRRGRIPCTTRTACGVPFDIERVSRRFWYQRISSRNRIETTDSTVDCAAARS